MNVTMKKKGFQLWDVKLSVANVEKQRMFDIFTKTSPELVGLIRYVVIVKKNIARNKKNSNNNDSLAISIKK